MIKLILIPLIVGLLCFIAVYNLDDIAVQYTIGLAYGMFLVIYGMIKIPNPSSSQEVYDFDYGVVEEEEED